MRVMQVIYSFGVGGSEVVAKNIALNMTGDVEHGVIALEIDGPLRQTLEGAGVRTWVIDKQPNERLRPMWRLLKAVQDFKPDVIHTHHLYELFYAWPGALLTGAHIVHTEHEYYSLMSTRACFQLRQLARFCGAVTGVNQETSAFLVQKVGIPSIKVHTIVNGIDLGSHVGDRQTREAFGLSEQDLIVGIVARLELVKDHSMLLRAFQRVVARLPRAKLLVIGDGSERPNLECLAQELGISGHIHFLGIRTDVPELMASMDLVVLSSKQEGLPLCILEAMASSKPLVATNVGGIPSVVIPDETGLLVPSGDVESMASALLYMLLNPDKAKHLGRNGRGMIEKYYDLKKTLASYHTLYEHCLR